MTRKQLPRAIRTDYGNTAASAAAVDEEAPARHFMLRRNGGDAAPASANAAPAPDAAPVASDPVVLELRGEAEKIVDRHRNYALAGGLLPIPVANIAGVTAIILRMVKQLSALYCVPFERERTRSFIVSLIAGTVPTGLGAATSSALVFAMQGSGFVGLAVSAVSAAALTRGIGLVFIEHFESAAMPGVVAEPA
jgi:uncharacterized protein (DUF697 family)